MPRRDPLLTVILAWTTLITGILFWLPLVRGLVEGREYRWELARGIGGRGTGGDYGLLVVGTLFALTMLYLGRRGAPRLFHAMLLLLHLPLTAAVFWLAITRPADFRFEGATMGIDVSLAWLGPLVFGTFAILCAAWIVRDLRRGGRPVLAPWRWSRVNLIRLAVLGALIPVQVAFLRGELGSAREMLGVYLTVAQWFVINRALNAPRTAGAPIAPPGR